MEKRLNRFTHRTYVLISQSSNDYYAETCEQQSFVPKNQNMQAFLFFCAKNLHIRFFCSNFAG